VKRAYKKLVARYHPDRAGRDKEGAELDAKLFKAIDEAYAAVRRSRQK
jgi:DnaJ-class molecular chaperone